MIKYYDKMASLDLTDFPFQKMPPNKSSFVWEYFKSEENKHACVLCKDFVYTGNTAITGTGSEYVI